MTERRVYGWRKDKRDENDYLLRATTRKAIPDIVNLSSILPAVRDQGNQGSCVGHGIGGIITGKAIQLGVFEEWFSPRWIYYLGRLLGGYVDEDNGTEPRLALEGLVKYGCLLESAWQYKSDFDASPPPDAAYAEALKRPLLSYSRVVDGFDGICSALAGDNLVAIGSPWPDKWNNIGADGELPRLLCWDEASGGHETFLYGYNRATKIIDGQNSWNTWWGDNGHYHMPASALNWFKKKGGYDAHIVQVNWTKLQALMRGCIAAGAVSR